MQRITQLDLHVKSPKLHCPIVTGKVQSYMCLKVKSNTNKEKNLHVGRWYLIPGNFLDLTSRAIANDTILLCIRHAFMFSDKCSK